MLVYFKSASTMNERGTVLRMTKEGIEEVKAEFERLRKLYDDDWGKVNEGLKLLYSSWDKDDPRKSLARFTRVDEKGPYRDDGNISWPGGGGPRYDVMHPVTHKPCKVPSRGWIYPNPQRMKEEIDRGRVVFGQDETTTPRIRTNLFEADKEVMRSVHFSYAQTASQTFNAIFDNRRVFENPKSMKDKEWLLSFDCPLRFIFSHSTLKEGWDNPNVFQVCTLIEQKSTLTARQKVGRGLRLCVNQDGERIEDRNINLLHVMANESFAEFADTLQKEIEEETGVKFGILQLDLFSGMVFEETATEETPLTEQQAETLLSHLAGEGFIKTGAPAPETAPELPKELEAAKQKAIEVIARDGDITPTAVTQLTAQKTVVVQSALTYDDAQQLMTHFENKGYITKSGKIKDSMKTAMRDGTLDLPPKFETARSQLMATIRRADTRPPVRDASRDVTVRLKKEVMVSPEFLELWDKVKQKTTYRVQIDEAELIRRSVAALQSMEPIPKARIVTQTADIQIDHPGVTYTERGIKTADLADSYSSLPNILAILDGQTLARRSVIAEILKQSGRGQDFLNNPQMFIENAAEIIRDACYSLAIDGISYKKLYGAEYYVQEIFDSAELIANLDRNAVAVDHSVYDYIVYDSAIENRFALDLDDDPDVKMFFKLPSRFQVDTPIGTYNPDWAVYVEIDGTKKLYFILETKGSTNELDLRGRENLKIRCGRAHFKAVNSGAELHTASRWKDFKVRNV